MNGLGSFHRIGTVTVPQGSRPEWGQTGTAATAKPKKPHVLGNGKRAPWRTCPIEAKRTCTYRRTVPEYEGTRVPRYI